MSDFESYSTAPSTNDVPAGESYVKIMNSRAKGDKLEETAKLLAKGDKDGTNNFFPKHATRALSSNESSSAASTSAWDGAIADIYKAKKNIKQGFNTGSQSSDYKNAIGKLVNANSHAAEGALGIAHNVACGDGLTGIDFKLQELARACDLEIDKMSTYNACGRKIMKNPIEGFIKSVKRLEAGLEELINLPGKMFNDILDKVSQTIDSLGLPFDLMQCLTNKTLDSFKVGHIKSPVGLANKLNKAYNTNICASSQQGLKSNSDIINKAVATPIVSSAVSFDEKTMLAFATAMIDSDVIDNNILAESLKDTITDKPNPNVVKTLIFLAFIKASKNNKETTITSDLGNINSNLHSNNSSDVKIVDTIINANETGEQMEPLDIAATGITKNETDNVSSSYIKSEVILNSMTDDYSETLDAEKDYNKIMSLIKIADSKFNPEELLYKLYLNVTISTLAKILFTSNTCEVNESEITERVVLEGEPADVVFRNVEDNLAMNDKIAILSILNEDGELVSA